MTSILLTPQIKAAQLQALEYALLILRSLPTQTPCAACIDFSAGFCSRWKAAVPETAQAEGCQQFDYLPF